MRTFILVVVLAGTARAGDVVIDLDADLPLSTLLERIQDHTGKPLIYDPNGQRIRGQTIGARVVRNVPEERLFDAYRAILSFYELTLVPVGPAEYEVWLVIDSRSTNNFVKNKAQFVTVDELPKLADRDGLFVACAIPVRHIENLTVLRTGLTSMVTPAGIGRVWESPDTGAIMVMDFAPTVATIARIVAQLDVATPGDEWTMELIRLEHAWAPDLADVLSDVLKREDAAPPARRGAAPASAPAPRVRAYERLNALAVGAIADDLALIRALVAGLDAPAPEGRQVEVVRLRHRPAAEVARALGGAATAVVHASTNSLLLAGDAEAVARAKRMARMLDRRPI